VDGTLVRQETVNQTVVPVSPEWKSAIRTGKPYIWQVTALDASGKAVASSSREHFRVGTIKP
jgi:hypothetical protein